MTAVDRNQSPPIHIKHLISSRTFGGYYTTKFSNRMLVRSSAVQTVITPLLVMWNSNSMVVSVFKAQGSPK